MVMLSADGYYWLLDDGADGDHRGQRCLTLAAIPPWLLEESLAAEWSLG